VEAHRHPSQYEVIACSGSDTSTSSPNLLAGTPQTCNAKADVTSSSPGTHRPPCGCIGIVYVTSAAHFVGGCAGAIDNSGESAILNMRRPVGGCIGCVYYRNNTRFVGGCPCIGRGGKADGMPGDR
jgi:hypothetical protein